MSYPWHEAAWQHTNGMLKQARIPHALLLSGKHGMGLMQFANRLSQRILCSNPHEAGNSCGHCQSCQLFKAGTHPDIKLIEPEEQGKQIRIDQVRELIEFVALKSFSNRAKLAILSPAEAMNRATANALLKTLEEPPEQSMLLLLSHMPERLPITIRSRCQRIDFKAVYDDATVDWLQQQNLETDYPLDLLLHLADGGPLKVLEMLDDETLQDRLRLMTDICSMAKSEVDPVRLAAEWENFGCVQVIICLMRVCQDLVRLNLLKDKANLQNKDLKNELILLAEDRELTSVLRFYSFLQAKYQQASSSINYNSLSLLEEIIIYWNNPSQVPQ